VVGETLCSTAFQRKGFFSPSPIHLLTRGFAFEEEHEGGGVIAFRHELAFAKNVKYGISLDLTRTYQEEDRYLCQENRDIDIRHHDGIEFPDGNYVMVNQLIEESTSHCAAAAGDRKPSRLPKIRRSTTSDDLPPDQLADSRPFSPRARETHANPKVSSRCVTPSRTDSWLTSTPW